MESLKSMAQHRSIRLIQDVSPNLDYEIRAYAKEVAVERRVMELAKGEAVRDMRFAERIRVGDYVCGVE